jgi:hypothetical protein
MYDGPEAALHMLMRQSQGMRTSIRVQWRLFCLTPHVDSELMWARYGDSHRGIALQHYRSGPLAQQAFGAGQRTLCCCLLLQTVMA